MLTYFKSQLDLQTELHPENLFPSTSYVMLEAEYPLRSFSFFVPFGFQQALPELQGQENQNQAQKNPECLDAYWSSSSVPVGPDAAKHCSTATQSPSHASGVGSGLDV